MADKLYDIHMMSSPHYGIAVQAQPIGADQRPRADGGALKTQSAQEKL
jgi:hypothetical protein